MINSIKPTLIPTLTLTATALALSAFTAQAQELRIYNWSDYIAEDTIEKFEKQTGITVTYDVFDSNEVLEAKLLAGASGYDIVVPTSDFLQRQIAAGIYQKLDKSKLPNLKNMDADLMANAATYDTDNAHSVIYLWGTTGIGYNINAVRERLGDDYEINSWDMVFNPENAAKLADCGISMLDAPTEVIPAAANYLGYNPNTEDAGELREAAELLSAVRPYVRYFHSSQYINDLANGDSCVAVGWSGDVFIAQARADEAENGVEIDYFIPREGALQWFDMLAIPADAPNVDAAHAFINFLMEPEITADITNYVWYGSANQAALPLIDAEILENEGIFPSAAAKENLWGGEVVSIKSDRLRTRLWTKITTGQ
ncbi:MAG: polyamine ABC transporter substrate-binding protein [Candidatus Halichondribacter symbioticus]